MAKPDDFLKQLRERFTAFQIAQLDRGWCVQNRTERKYRLRNVIALSCELERIRAVSIFCTAFGEGAIEAIIVGDWTHAADYVDFLSFDDLPEESRVKHVELWKAFVLILKTSCEEAIRNPRSDDDKQISKPS